VDPQQAHARLAAVAFDLKPAEPGVERHWPMVGDGCNVTCSVTSGNPWMPCV
jgi:hypothetical protein